MQLTASFGNLRFCGVDVSVHPFWEPFWTAERRQWLNSIEIRIGSDFTPPPDKVLRFLQLGEVRCVILGQDPYFQPGVATGRAFEVAGISSWEDPKVNTALRNIVKLLYQTYYKLPEPVPIAVVRADKHFPLPPPNQLFDAWEAQGVLLLNTALTCRIHHPGSHMQIWKPFTDALIRYIDHRVPHAAWFLWGDHAKRYAALLGPTARVYLGSHPSSRNRSFFEFRGFADTADLVRWI